MDFQNVDGIIFDVDGTLWDSTYVVAHAWNARGKERYGRDLSITAPLLKQEFGKLLPDIAASLFPFLSKDEQLIFIEECCQAEHDALLATPPDVYPGLEKTLEELSKQYPLYIVSNCQAGYIEVFCQATGLGHYFKDHLCPGDTGHAKADNIKTIVDRHHLKNAVYIGDTMGDYKATKAAGLPFIFASYGFGQVSDPDGVITTPADLLKLL